MALKALGHDTTILERNPAPLLQDQGAGIVAGGDTLAFLKRYNRIQNRSVAVTSHARQYLNREGKIVHKIITEQHMTSWDLTYYLMRANYDGVRSSYFDDRDIPPPDPRHGKAVHLHDRTVVALEQEESEEEGQEEAEKDKAGVSNDENSETEIGWKPKGGRVRVFWESSKGEKGSVVADIVVGADGPSSTVRRIVQPDVERKYAGYCALRGTLIESEASEETKKTFCERFTFFHCPGVQYEFFFFFPFPLFPSAFSWDSKLSSASFLSSYLIANNQIY
jgi:2-polyprenyl-6-methoxyphenol hydroxylase-like FAD-dependent oxidoreductase